MAGIGFSIQKILKKNTYSASIQAYFYSTIIFSGPWILSILTIFCLDRLTPQSIDILDMLYFRTIIIYVFAFSFITVGLFHFPLTRYLADKLYLGEKEAIIPTFNASMLYVLLLQSLSGMLVMSQTSMGLSSKVLIILTYMTISSLWVSMIFLSTLRAFKVISLFYLIGSVIAVVGSLFLGQRIGITGYFVGYLLGHLFIVVGWSARIFGEFNSRHIFDAGIFLFLVRNYKLILIGLFYNLAVWIDKIIFWLSPEAKAITAFFKTFPTYENPVFFAHLTIIPALSILLIQIETDFYRRFRRYYRAIEEKAAYDHIRQLREEIMVSLKKGAVSLIRCQATLSILVIIFSPQIANMIHMPWIQIPIFRIAVLGTFVHSLLLMVIIITLYFDFQWNALLISAVFFFTNGLFTWVMVGKDIPYFGYGYLLSTVVTLFIAWHMLDYKLRRLEYYTFALQPVAAV